MEVRIPSAVRSPKELIEEGFSIRYLQRRDHPRKLIQESLYGPWATTGSPQAFVVVTDDGSVEVLATISGKEGDDDQVVESLYDVVDIARARLGMEPIFRAPW
jgi:hypothetical protein